jgi:phosphopantetheinyl transferase
MLIVKIFNVKEWEPTDTETDILCSQLRSSTEVARIKKFIHTIDQHRALVGQLLIRKIIMELLPDVSIKSLVITRDENGKPFLVRYIFTNSLFKNL